MSTENWKQATFGQCPKCGGALTNPHKCLTGRFAPDSAPTSAEKAVERIEALVKSTWGVNVGTVERGLFQRIIEEEMGANVEEVVGRVDEILLSVSLPEEDYELFNKHFGEEEFYVAIKKVNGRKTRLAIVARHKEDQP